MAKGLSDFNRALVQIPKRAEQRSVEQLRRTFVDSGVAAILEGIDHQVLYGRRGTGKTHALGYLQSEVTDAGDVGILLDLRTLGSPDGIHPIGADVPPIARTGKLLVDILTEVQDVILDAVIADSDLIADDNLVRSLDELAASLSTMAVFDGHVELETEKNRHRSGASSFGVSIDAGLQPALSLSAGASESAEDRSRTRRLVRGDERLSLNFSQIARALKNVADGLATKRVWLLMDEWSSVPSDVQPFLADFLARCVLPLQQFTVKIAAIEQRTSFLIERDGRSVGLELGSDISANVDLDNFMVFDQDEDSAREFVVGLLRKNLSDPEVQSEELRNMISDDDVVRLGFTEIRALNELVKAGEGVPRDVINIAAKAALRARDREISAADVRVAARAWYQTDKLQALQSRPEAIEFLNWIIDEVIGGRKARGFLVNQREKQRDLLLLLFDARLLHIVRRGYSAQDQPGERFDVWIIDYGAYVDLIRTKSEPQGLLPTDDEEIFVDVPPQDLRAIRRAVLDFDKYPGQQRLTFE